MNLLRKVAAPSEAPIQHASSQQVYLNPLEYLNDQHQDFGILIFSTVVTGEPAEKT